MSQKPNIVYIIADDIGYGDLSCFNTKSRIHPAYVENGRSTPGTRQENTIEID